MLVVETIGKIRRAYFVQGKPSGHLLSSGGGAKGLLGVGGVLASVV